MSTRKASVTLKRRSDNPASIPPELLEARHLTNLDRLSAHDARIKRIEVIADSLFNEVVRHNSQAYPAKVVASVAFLIDELAKGRDEQNEISEQFFMFEDGFSGGEK